MKKLLALFLFPLIANAEPGPTTQYLMNEPATLFDIGMMRLGALTSQFQQRVGLSWLASDGRREFFKAEVNSEYDSDHNKIYVSFLVMNSDATATQMEEGCRVATEQMTFWLGKALPGLFMHAGGKSSADANGLLGALQDMFVLRCYVSSEHSTAEGRFWATKTLRDNALTIGRWN
jgi:hypothetical protein